jgi:hypothetical protein
MLSSSGTPSTGSRRLGAGWPSVAAHDTWFGPRGGAPEMETSYTPDDIQAFQNEGCFGLQVGIPQSGHWLWLYYPVGHRQALRACRSPLTALTTSGASGPSPGSRPRW